MIASPSMASVDVSCSWAVEKSLHGMRFGIRWVKFERGVVTKSFGKEEEEEEEEKNLLHPLLAIALIFASPLPNNSSVGSMKLWRRDQHATMEQSSKGALSSLTPSSSNPSHFIQQHSSFTFFCLKLELETPLIEKREKSGEK